MKKVTRFGVIVFLIGVSLLLVTVLRAGSSMNVACGSTIMPLGEWEFFNFLFAPRDLEMVIQTNATIEVYILDESGIRLWKTEGIIKPLLNVTSTEYEPSPLQLMQRGNYGILVHCPQDSTLATISISLYGFERDLLWVSTALILAGPLIIIVYSTITRNSLKK